MTDICCEDPELPVDTAVRLHKANGVGAVGASGEPSLKSSTLTL
jgi:hypothetical protein